MSGQPSHGKMDVAIAIASRAIHNGLDAPSSRPRRLVSTISRRHPRRRHGISGIGWPGFPEPTGRHLVRL